MGPAAGWVQELEYTFWRRPLGGQNPLFYLNARVKGSGTEKEGARRKAGRKEWIEGKKGGGDRVEEKEGWREGALNQFKPPRPRGLVRF